MGSSPPRSPSIADLSGEALVLGRTERDDVMLSCKEAIRLASEALDRPLPFRARIGLRMHLLMCAGCRSVSRQMKGLDSLIRDRFAREPDARSTSQPADPAARDRARQAIHSALDRKD